MKTKMIINTCMKFYIDQFPVFIDREHWNSRKANRWSWGLVVVPDNADTSYSLLSLRATSLTRDQYRPITKHLSCY